ncbi:DUF2339 domain-containing protein [Acinetobacter larvae]|uniref:DUF2339 domain-containing protein n=1 Tax=Acinetobacter larvae TaxID=1789224 RepID=A0A1B2M1S0_9GAMM|nr:DUF2339 domain-containing protein [Acinetobacter larvae]AOA59146.1 hypothetical protein BFG52_12820 [Acinetobacter larvae]
MQKNHDIQFIWLMGLSLITGGAWFFELHAISYLCILALVCSVMHYVSQLQQQSIWAAQRLQQGIQPTAKWPLYLSIMTALCAGLLDWYWLLSLSLSIWLFLFFRWLRLIEHTLTQIQQRLAELPPSEQDPIQASLQPTQLVAQTPAPPETLGFWAQCKQWLWQGNPVLKAAIVVLVIGIILLLRFASEHWQLDLAWQLIVFSAVCLLVLFVGYRLGQQNRGFALGLQGLAIAGLCLALFFAYYNQLLLSLWSCSLLFCLIMLLAIALSLKQQALELALMAMVVAYLAPFSLPLRDGITTQQLVAYYALVLAIVALLTSIRPWKILNQLAFMISLTIAVGYAWQHQDFSASTLSLLILLHSAIYIWLSFRYSQLLMREDFQGFQLRPILDVAMLFAAPISAFILIYLLYFQQSFWQVSCSLVFAGVHAGLAYYCRSRQQFVFIADSYLSLSLIFLLFIPAILAPEAWSISVWGLAALLVWILALQRQSIVARYVALGLFFAAALSCLYYDQQQPELNLWIQLSLAVIYIVAVLWANHRPAFRRQLGEALSVFLALMMLAAFLILLRLIPLFYASAMDEIWALLLCSALFMLCQQYMRACQARWTWYPAKCLLLLVLSIYALMVLFDYHFPHALQWPNLSAALLFSASCLFLAWSALQQQAEQTIFARECCMGVGVFCLSMLGIAIWPQHLILASSVGPMAYWLYSVALLFKNGKGQALDCYAMLLFFLIWLVYAQLNFSFSASHFYLPLCNSFDLMSILMLTALLYLLNHQRHLRSDHGLLAMIAVFSLLWTCSYILLRALHVYAETPYNQTALWFDATVQLSLTVLWSSIAFIMMTLATAKSIRGLWYLGASILVMMNFKLVLLDLANIGTLMRVCSFLIAGGLMLLIAYLAPIPDSVAKDSSPH